MERITSDDGITIRDGKYTIAHFEDNGNGIDGEICEGNEPIALGGRPIRMQASDLIAIAKWLLEKAEERATDIETGG